MDSIKENVKLFEKIMKAVSGALTPQKAEQILKALEARKELEKFKQEHCKKDD